MLSMTKRQLSRKSYRDRVCVISLLHYTILENFVTLNLFVNSRRKCLLLSVEKCHLSTSHSEGRFEKLRSIVNNEYMTKKLVSKGTPVIFLASFLRKNFFLSTKFNCSSNNRSMHCVINLANYRKKSLI